ncbi:hypothetical protein [Nitrospira sp. Nam74]
MAEGEFRESPWQEIHHGYQQFSHTATWVIAGVHRERNSRSSCGFLFPVVPLFELTPDPVTPKVHQRQHARAEYDAGDDFSHDNRLIHFEKINR